MTVRRACVVCGAPNKDGYCPEHRPTGHSERLGRILGCSRQEPLWNQESGPMCLACKAVYTGSIRLSKLAANRHFKLPKQHSPATSTT